MAFVNDNLKAGSFVNDSIATHNTNFAVDQYTKYIAQDFTADDTFQYYGKDNDFGFMYSSADNELNLYSGDNKLLEITKEGVLTINSTVGPNVDVFRVNDSLGRAIFAVNSSGMEIEVSDFKVGSHIGMAAADELLVSDNDHGFTFYNGDAYAKVGEE